MTDWLRDAVLYQIYPQSFADGNGDGIGDLAGLESRLEYLAWLGVDAVWLNPCFDSPMGDAGYDVRDYRTVDRRYGTQDDMVRLVESARSKGIRVLLDLVAGHTSDQHAWFRAAADDPSDDRYIWSDGQVTGFVPSPGSRPGSYLPNFFSFQPALNFGYARTDPAEPWRQPVDAEGPRRNRQELRDIMTHWIDLGVSGFRVDMAASLVKDDPDRAETAKLWRELRGWIDHRHPQAVLLSEWSDPKVAVPGGFHADFFLHFSGMAFRSLWDNGAVKTRWAKVESCFFDAAGLGSPEDFLAEWREAVEAIDGSGHISLPTSNHDWPRLASGARTAEQLRAAYTFLLTWPTLPAIYYGDEIGMRYVPGLPDVEGSQITPDYNRAGSRTPMQWDKADPAVTYLPADPSPDRPNVADQRADPGSLLHTVRDLIALRRANPELGTSGEVEVLHAGYPLVYRRGRFLVAVNPGAAPAAAPIDPPRGRLIFGAGAEGARLDGFGYAIYELV
ncbi:alpha-amylase family glycosyl hydrolase [Nonomuraea soli]|uniref:Maltose alpha-D-glucosyltransferase/alpha-amylase n=1 Tax=Nonomuraea soli TaxID=1032476 RepID=A0A7W0HN62_9ACTN|nr:alpha-amylase family glycosyl hydrolase [Nonomuraea soli]MBA2889495.1 maltose alpha-D-glucosyltransferase/alpha-amylase [Nonomuraea soli]